MWHYGAAASLADWPDHAVGKALPLLLLAVILLPRNRRVFDAQNAGQTESDPDTSRGDAPEPAAATTMSGGPLVSLLVLLLLIVTCSTLVVDGADWIQRLVIESRPDAV